MTTKVRFWLQMPEPSSACGGAVVVCSAGLSIPALVESRYFKRGTAAVIWNGIGVREVSCAETVCLRCQFSTWSTITLKREQLCEEVLGSFTWLGLPSTGLCASGKRSVPGAVTCKGGQSDHLVKSRAARERERNGTEVKKIVAASVPLNCFMQSSPSQGNTFRRRDGAVHWILLKKISVLIIKAVLSYRTSIGNCLILCFFFVIGDHVIKYTCVLLFLENAFSLFLSVVVGL